MTEKLEAVPAWTVLGKPLSFNVEAEGKDRSTVINVTQLYLNDNMDLSIKGAVGSGGGIDPNRSYLDDIKAFPTNIEARSLLTFTSGGGGACGGAAERWHPSNASAAVKSEMTVEILAAVVRMALARIVKIESGPPMRAIPLYSRTDASVNKPAAIILKGRSIYNRGGHALQQR